MPGRLKTILLEAELSAGDMGKMDRNPKWRNKGVRWLTN